MDNKQELQKYIYAQIQSGFNPDEITAQLVGAGWDSESVKGAFVGVQSQIVPTQAPNPSAAPTATVGTFAASGRKRGRIKTSWLLLKQSIKVLKNNKQLLRYPLMGGIISILVGIVYGMIFVLGKNTFLIQSVDAAGQNQTDLTAVGLLVAFSYYVLSHFVIFSYNAGLVAHVLDIFKGKSEKYNYYMKIAWSKKGPIFVYSIITTTVGYILALIENRFKLVGWIVSKILGTVWAFANLFTIPIIVTEDLSAPKAIKKSTQLFISRWGENIAGRITFGLIAFLFYLLIAIPVLIVLGILSSFLGVAGILSFIVLMILSFILFAVIETAASQILSTSLFYYAEYQQIPAAFDAELLNSVFIPKKKRSGLFRKKTTE